MSSVVRSGKSARISGLGHAGGQVFQHVRHRDAHAANARFSAAFSGLNGDSILQMGFHVHYLRRATFMGKGQALPTLPEWAITGCLEGHRNLCGRDRDAAATLISAELRTKQRVSMPPSPIAKKGHRNLLGITMLGFARKAAAASFGIVVSPRSPT